jgi:HlyD family secretion protein
MIEERKQSIRLWFWRGSFILLVLAFFAARFLSKDRVTVHAAKAVRVPIVSTISNTGRVEPEMNYEIHSPISTTVKALFVQPGDHVAAGQLLLTLDEMEARARQATSESGVKSAQAVLDAVLQNGTLQERQASAADLERAHLDRDQARHALDALTKLNATGAASGSEVAAARERLETSEASLRAAELSAHSRYSPAEVERARAALADAQANLAAARQVVAQTTVRAPVAGTVYSLNTSPTEFVEAGKQLMKLADLRHERVRAYFDEPEIGRLAVGQKIQIKWDAKPDREWNGEIERTPSSVTTYGTRNVGEVLVKINDEDGQLLPDTNVRVTVTTSSDSNSLSVPREAIYYENGKPFLYKIVNNQLQKSFVTVGNFNLTQEAILSGLDEGDLVATGSVSGLPLRAGISIKVVQ